MHNRTAFAINRTYTSSCLYLTQMNIPLKNSSPVLYFIAKINIMINGICMGLEKSNLYDLSKQLVAPKI